METSVMTMDQARIQLRQLQELVRALEMIVDGGGPTERHLENAPFLDLWQLENRHEKGLAGYVAGHPILGDQYVHTSQVWALSKRGRWARTFSRWYRLGDAIDEVVVKS